MSLVNGSDAGACMTTAANESVPLRKSIGLGDEVEIDVSAAGWAPGGHGRLEKTVLHRLWNGSTWEPQTGCGEGGNLDTGSRSWGRLFVGRVRAPRPWCYQPLPLEGRRRACRRGLH